MLGAVLVSGLLAFLRQGLPVRVKLWHLMLVLVVISFTPVLNLSV